MQDLIVLAGPTAVGKSSLSIRLAKAVGGAIISADSMQVYRKMNIGTAKITKEEMEDIPHYLIDSLDPAEDFNIVYFQEKAREALDQIYASHKIPILVGGTGFYIHSLVYDTEFDESEEMPQYREKLRDLISIKGAEYVHSLLQDIDPAAASRIHPNDHKRMIRALEYHECTGGRISDHNAQNMAKKSAYNLCYFVLTDNRQKIYDRINARVDKMIEDGLVDEVRSLMAEGLTKYNVSMHGIGYKEIIDHLSGNCTFDEAVYRIKRESRHFAKRQLTWFSREKDVIWIDLDKDDDVLDTMINELKKKGIVNG